MLLAGRWAAIKTAKVYLNSGLAMLADIQIPKTLRTPFHSLFAQFSLQPSLEHALDKGRTGGRGSKRKVLKEGGGIPGTPF